MSLLHALGYVAVIVAFLFVTLSLASGLLWLSEIIEEHSTVAKVVGVRTIYVVIILHILLWLVDSFPLTQIAFSIMCHIVYHSNFTSAWPLISLTSPSFVASCLLVLADHFIWFFYFSKRTHATRGYGHASWRPTYAREGALTFTEIATFFGICVWLVPLFLFLSLSANDNALPVSNGNFSVPTTPMVTVDDSFSQHQLGGRHSTVQSNQTLFQNVVGPIIAMLPAIRRKRSSRDPDGIIAPRTPGGSRASSPVNHCPPSPLPSPSAMVYSPSWTTLEGSPAPRTPRFAAFQNETVNRHGPFLTSPPPRRATSDGARVSRNIITTSSGISRSNGAVSSKDEGKGSVGRRRANLMHLDLREEGSTNNHLVLVDDENSGTTF